MAEKVEMFKEERERIQKVYASRDSNGKQNLYSWHLPANLLMQYRINDVISSVLNKENLQKLSDRQCLDVGCGTGNWLRTLLNWGCSAKNLHGIDILPDRINYAKNISPNIDFQISDAWPINFPANSMDLVFANVVFSSIIDPNAREALAKEIIRITKQQGLIIIYDFRVSDPRNPDTIGIDKREISKLFYGMEFVAKTLILAPPLCRRIAKVSTLLAYFMERCFPFLRTHVVYAIKNPSIS